MLTDTVRNQLMHVSVATLTTALFKRGLRNQFIQDVRPLRHKGKNMVGPAFTLRYIPAREDLNPLSVFQARDHPQRRAVEEHEVGAVVGPRRHDLVGLDVEAGSIAATEVQVNGSVTGAR